MVLADSQIFISQFVPDIKYELENKTKMNHGKKPKANFAVTKPVTNLVLFSLGWDNCYMDEKLVVGSEMVLIYFLCQDSSTRKFIIACIWKVGHSFIVVIHGRLNPR